MKLPDCAFLGLEKQGGSPLLAVMVTGFPITNNMETWCICFCNNEGNILLLVKVVFDNKMASINSLIVLIYFSMSG